MYVCVCFGITEDQAKNGIAELWASSGRQPKPAAIRRHIKPNQEGKGCRWACAADFCRLAREGKPAQPAISAVALGAR